MFRYRKYKACVYDSVYFYSSIGNILTTDSIDWNIVVDSRESWKPFPGTFIVEF